VCCEKESVCVFYEKECISERERNCVCVCVCVRVCVRGRERGRDNIVCRVCDIEIGCVGEIDRV
jgi:hypothetical protein